MVLVFWQAGDDFFDAVDLADGDVEVGHLGQRKEIGREKLARDWNEVKVDLQSWVW